MADPRSSCLILETMSPSRRIRLLVPNVSCLRFFPFFNPALHRLAGHNRREGRSPLSPAIARPRTWRPAAEVLVQFPPLEVAPVAPVCRTRPGRSRRRAAEEQEGGYWDVKTISTLYYESFYG